MTTADAYWVVVPAAGVGRRMGLDTPKQYLKLNDRTVIEHALAPLVAAPQVQRVVVAIAADDGYWPDLPISDHPKIEITSGGQERADSVLNGLLALQGRAKDGDWVLVHDAARPCLRSMDLERLMTLVKAHPVGGLLGIPLHDTVKRADESGSVLETLPREQLWRAFTPQMFRFATLRDALHEAQHAGRLITDEASALEFMGLHPLMVEGSSDNIKITRGEDLALAAFYLRQQGED